MLTIAQGLAPLDYKTPPTKAPAPSFNIKGTKIAIIGRTPVIRTDLYQLIEKRGGIVHSKVGKTTNLVVLGVGIDKSFQRLKFTTKAFMDIHDFIDKLSNGENFFR